MTHFLSTKTCFHELISEAMKSRTLSTLLSQLIRLIKEDSLSGQGRSNRA